MPAAVVFKRAVHGLLYAPTEAKQLLELDGDPQNFEFLLLAPPAFTVRDLLSTTLVAGLLYSLGAAVIGVLFKRGQVIALGYAFAFEVLLANVPGSAQKLSLQFYLRSLFVDAEGAAWRSLELFERGEFLTPDAAALRIAITGAVLVLVGCFAVTRKQFVLSS